MLSGSPLPTSRRPLLLPRRCRRLHHFAALPIKLLACGITAVNTLSRSHIVVISSPPLPPTIPRPCLKPSPTRNHNPKLEEQAPQRYQPTVYFLRPPCTCPLGLCRVADMEVLLLHNGACQSGLDESKSAGGLDWLVDVLVLGSVNVLSSPCVCVLVEVGISFTGFRGRCEVGVMAAAILGRFCYSGLLLRSDILDSKSSLTCLVLVIKR